MKKNLSTKFYSILLNKIWKWQVNSIYWNDNGIYDGHGRTCKTLVANDDIMR